MSISALQIYDAVYLARTMYNLIEPTAAFDDDEICNALASFKKEQARKAKVQPLSVTVSPNPASTEVDIVIKGTEEDVLLTMYNTMGQVVEQKNVNHYIEMQVSGLANGVYTIVFTHKDGNSITERLIVNK